MSKIKKLKEEISKLNIQRYSLRAPSDKKYRKMKIYDSEGKLISEDFASNFRETDLLLIARQGFSYELIELPGYAEAVREYNTEVSAIKSQLVNLECELQNITIDKMKDFDLKGFAKSLIQFSIEKEISIYDTKSDSYALLDSTEFLNKIIQFHTESMAKPHEK